MKRFQINEGVKIFRINDDVSAVLHSDMNNVVAEEMNNSTEFLLSICKRGNGRQTSADSSDKYSIEVFNQQQHPLRKHNIYLIVRSLKAPDGRNQRGYSLRTGDVIKLGRIEYRVAEMQTNKREIGSSDINIGDQEFNVDTQVVPPGTDMCCRYCLHDQKDNNVEKIDNALLFCCVCTGSAGGVHFICLKNWIKNKIVSKSNNNTYTYQWKKLECELCKTPLPRWIIFKNVPHELINIERPDCPYIILEKMPSPSENVRGATLSLIVPTDQEAIKLGRGHQCDLRISDISVSRVHAFLRYQENHFLIYDNESKFGTLILLHGDYEIKNDKAAIQIGRTVFTFVQKSPNSMLRNDGGYDINN